MSLLITFLGLFGLAGSAKYMHKQYVDDKRYRIENDPKNTIPNKYSPGYTQYREDYSKWEERYKIYQRYCSQVESIWVNKLNEMIRYSGKARKIEESYNMFGIYFDALCVGISEGFVTHASAQDLTIKRETKNLPYKFLHRNERSWIVPVTVRVSNIASQTIPNPKQFALAKFPNNNVGFNKIEITVVKTNTKENQWLDECIKNNTLLLDKNGEYSKTISDFENEAITETKILRRKYEKAGFVFPKFAEEYSAYEKWINPANRNYTKYNT